MNKAKTEFSITDFGALGDGMFDCTEAIQNALDHAAGCMGTVIVPPGTYSTGNLRVHGKGVSIVGCPAWSFRNDGGSVFLLRDGTTDCMLDISGAFGCSIQGMCLDGRNIGADVHGIKLYRSQYNGGGEEDTPTVDNCRIGHFSGNGLHFEHVWCFSVRHSMLHANGGAGLFIDGWDAFILDNWFTGNKNGGILGGKTVASVTCTGNRVEWNKRGGFILPNGDSYNITGNFFDRSFGPALDLGGESTSVHTVTVTGNIFRRSGARLEAEAILPRDKSCHVSIHNCLGTVISGNSARAGRNDNGHGVYSPDYSIIVNDCKECIVKDNVMTCGAIVENIVLVGNNETCMIADNIGSLGNG
ncbi:MAG: hypothetical protein E7643_04575 [Ruminococcaceae bacterium]|nr:hypothetical protein [Oscillospiraceae bacterium]